MRRPDPTCWLGMLAALTCSTLPSSAQAGPQTADPKDTPGEERSLMSAPERVHVPEGGTTIPLVPGMALPTVEVYIGDAGPFRFIVEWAGNVFAVSERVRDRAGLESLGLFADGGGHESELVAVPELLVGDAAFEGLTAGVFSFFDRTDHDGALGLNVFQELVGTLDFPSATLHLSSTSLPTPEEDSGVVSYSPGPGGTPRVPIELGGKPFHAVLDTAAESKLIVDDSFLDQLPLAGELEPGPMIMTPAMGRLQTRRARIEGELVVGGARSAQPLAMFHPMQEPEILLGGGFLREYALTLDQRNRRLRLAKSDGHEAETR